MSGSGGAPAGGVSGDGGVPAGGATTGGVAGQGGADGGACPGAAPIPDGQTPCRSYDDCGPSELCTETYIPPAGCGACLPGPPRECETDPECGGSMVCVEYDTTGMCYCDAGFECSEAQVCDPARAQPNAHGCAVARCDIDGYECPAGYRCEGSTGANDSGCVAISCTEGFECPPNTDCGPDSFWPHDCERRACESDSDCDCGFCLFGLCRDQLFVCSPPSPP
jgi:hypothetical protein